MSSKQHWAVFASGVSAGIALAFFCTPKMRAEASNNVRDKVNEGIRNLRDKKVAVERAVEREIEGVNAALDAGKRAYSTTKGHGQQTITA